MAKRVLIADDSVTIQRAFAMTFAAEDVTALTARSADEAFMIARQSRPDLVIADAVMPGRSGYELAAAIKAEPSLRGVPVLILASSHNPYDEVRGRQSGADGHLLKPFDSTALIDRVREAIEKGAGATTAAVVAAPARRPTPVDEAYGELSIEATPARDLGRAPGFVSGVTPTPPANRSQPGQAPGGRHPAAQPPMSPGMTMPGLRPSLIPGVRPGSLPAQRPGTNPVRPLASQAAGPPAGAPLARSPVPQMPPAAAARTLMGVPVAGATLPGRSATPARPGLQTVRPGIPTATATATATGTMTPAHLSSAASVAPAVPVAPIANVGPTALATAAVSAAVDQRLAAVAARGPEYEAIAKLSRDVIERIVWEVVPELAEAIIREELQKRRMI